MVRLDTGKPGAHAGAEMHGGNFGKEFLNFGWLRLGFGAGFGGFLQLAETLDPHLPQEFPPAGEMRRGGNTHCELKIVVRDFEKSWKLESNLVIVIFVPAGDRASGNGRGIPSALPGFFIEIRLTRSDGDSLAPTGWSTMKDGVVFISLQPSTCWLSPVEVFFVFGLLSRQALRGVSFPTKKNLREKIMAFQSPTKALSMAQARD
jgi:hypothetical protein